MKARIEDNQLIIAQKVLIKKPEVTRRLLCNLLAFTKHEVSLPNPEMLFTSPHLQLD